MGPACETEGQRDGDRNRTAHGDIMVGDGSQEQSGVEREDRVEGHPILALGHGVGHLMGEVRAGEDDRATFGQHSGDGLAERSGVQEELIDRAQWMRAYADGADLGRAWPVDELQEGNLNLQRVLQTMGLVIADEQVALLD